MLQLVESSGALSESDGAYLFRQLVCALSYMHHCQVVHRDIKPENLVLKDGRFSWFPLLFGMVFDGSY